MKISDELRMWSEGSHVDDEASAKLCELANCIDKEMAWLPKDADGLPIKLMDKVHNSDGRSGCVTRIDCRINKECFITFWTKGGYVKCPPEEIKHTQADNWKHIADELEDWGWRVGLDTSWGHEIYCRTSDFAKRIRELAEEEDD